jgi:hypothetical protein
MLASRGDPEDATRALALVEEALEIMRSVGMHGYVPRTEEIRRRIGASTHSVEERAALRRDGDFWLLTFAGESQRLRELKGVHYLAYLLARPNQVCHVLEVISGSEEVDFAAWAAVGGAGPLLDTKAKIAYRRRLSELRADLEEARARGDCDRAAMAEEEIEGLARELSRAVGLRGRDRQAGDSTERARVNVVRRINAVVEQVMQTSPTLGIHLRQAIRTGMFCTYLPGSNSSVACRL